MDRPTAADVRAWSPPQFDWAAAGFPAPAGSDPEPIGFQKRVEWVVGEIENITGRPFPTIVAPPDGSSDPNLIPVAEQATVLKTMFEVLAGTKAALKVMQAPWLKAFTAGSYSESRFSPAELSGISGRGSEHLASLGPEPLATLLLMLMTPDKRADWIYLIQGKVKPAVAVVGGHHHDREGGPFVFGSGVEHGWPFGGW